MKYTYEDVSFHNTLNDCWIIYNNYVYNITNFLNKHPGGNKIILDYAGLDITNNYIFFLHSNNAYNILSKYKIGSIINTII
jgi:cytochrome b involved in lipid metabolism